jgi:hypothetical protein
MEEIIVFLLIVWLLFLLGGSMVLLTYMLWVCLRDMFKGEW